MSVWPARLHHVALISPNPARLADWYAGNLQTETHMLDDGALLPRGRERCYVLRAGPGPALDHLGYAVDDLAPLAALAEWPSPLFGVGRTTRDSDGNQLIFGLAPPEPELEPAGRFARLQHAGLATPAIAPMRQFYEVLGWRPSDLVADGDSEITAAFLRSDAEHHSLALFRSSRSGPDHFCHETADWNGIRDWADHLAAQGTRIEWGAGRHGAGNNLFIFVRDPDGNTLEFSAELATVAEDAPTGRWRHEERTLNLWGSAWMRS